MIYGFPSAFSVLPSLRRNDISPAACLARSTVFLFLFKKSARLPLSFIFSSYLAFAALFHSHREETGQRKRSFSNLDITISASHLNIKQYIRNGNVRTKHSLHILLAHRPFAFSQVLKFIHGVDRIQARSRGNRILI